MFRGYVADSWRNRERNLYGRMDFRYDGNGPAKLYEYNADTPTSLYESAIFQWVWLEQAMEQGLIPEGADQFNSLHERLTDAFGRLGIEGPLHLACARDTDEDLGTVEYLEDCARQAGLATRRLFIEDIGLAENGRFTDLDDEPVRWLFKLYPWEWLMEEEFGSRIPGSGAQFIEPGWKAVLSNKGLLALLWEMFEGHPNLLPAFFEDDPKAASLAGRYVRKPLLSREGANIAIVENGQAVARAPTDPMAPRGSCARRWRRCLRSTAGGRCAASGWWRASLPACASARTKAPSPPTTPVSSRISSWIDARRSAEVGEHLVRVVGGRYRVVAFEDGAVRADQHGDALRPLGFGVRRRAVGYRHRPVGVAQQVEREGELVPEGPVVLGRVETAPDDCRVLCLEVLDSVTEPVAFDGSAARVGLRIPPDQHIPPGEVLEADGRAVLVDDPEYRGGFAGFSHGHGSPSAQEMVSGTDAGSACQVSGGLSAPDALCARIS